MSAKILINHGDDTTNDGDNNNNGVDEISDIPMKLPGGNRPGGRPGGLKRRMSLFQVQPRTVAPKPKEYEIVHCDKPVTNNSQSSLFSSIMRDADEDEAEEGLYENKKENVCNTYEIPKNHFHTNDLFKSIKTIIRETCENRLSNASRPINPNNSFQLKELIKEIADVIKNEIKPLNGMERYRIISTCSFLAGTKFSGKIGSGFLWNQIIDNYVDYSHKLSFGCLLCSVYMICLE